MLNEKIGSVIKALRIQSGMTQKQLGDKLGISDKTVSKWERGLGAPELSLISEISKVLGVNVSNLLLGELSKSDLVGGNMKNATYYICTTCQNITVCTGGAEVSCCGKKLEPCSPIKATKEHRLEIEVIEDEWYITTEHSMTKAHYISFIAFATGERIELIKQYPEWHVNVRIPKKGRGMLLWYCTEHGLFYQYL